MNSNYLREAVNEVMRHQFTHSREAMHALQVLIDAADEAADEIERLRTARAESEEIKPPVGEIGPWLAIESHLRCALNAITTARRGEHSDLMLDAAEYQARCGLDVILRARAMHEHQVDIETSRFAVKLKARGA